jgi:hypothetical protein
MVMGDHPLQYPGAPDLRVAEHAEMNFRADQEALVVHQLEEWDSDEDLEELEFDTLDTLEDMENPEADIVLGKDKVPMDGEDCWDKLKAMLTEKLEEEADEDDDPTNDDDEIKIGKLRHQVDRDPEGRGYTRFVANSEDWLSLHKDWTDEQQIRRKKKLKDAAKSMVTFIGGEKEHALNALRGIWELSCRDINHGNIEDFAIMAIARMLADETGKVDDEMKMICSGILWCMWENMVEKNSELKPQLLNIIKILINACTPKTKAQKQHEAGVKAAKEAAKSGVVPDEDAPAPPPPVPEKKLSPAEEAQASEWRYRTKVHCSGALASLATNDYAQSLMKDADITSELVRIAPVAPHAMAALCYCLQRGDAHEIVSDGAEEKTARAKFNSALKGLKGGIKMQIMGKHALGSSAMRSTHDMKKDQIKLKKARPNLAVRKLLQKRMTTASELVELLTADDYEIRLCTLGVLTLITKDSVGVRSLSHARVMHTLVDVLKDSIDRWKAGMKLLKERKRRKMPPPKRKNSVVAGGHGQKGESAFVSVCSRDPDDTELLLQMAQYAACTLHGCCYAIACASFPEQLDVELHGKYKPPPECRDWAKAAAKSVTKEEIMFMISVARGGDKQMAMRALDALACLGHTSAADVMAQQPELLDAVILLTGSSQHRARASACSCIVGMAQNVEDQSVLFSKEELLTNILLSFSPKFENDRLLCEHAAAALFFMCKNARLQVLANITRDNMDRALVPFKMSNLLLIKYAASSFFHIALIRTHRTTFAELGAPALLVGWTATLLVSGQTKGKKIENSRGKMIPGTPEFAAWQLEKLPDDGVEGRLHLLEYLTACIWLMSYDEKAAISFGEETGGLLVLIDLVRDCDAQIGVIDTEERAALERAKYSRPVVTGSDVEFAAAAAAFLGTDAAEETEGAKASVKRAELRASYVELKVSALASMMVACDIHPHNMTIVIMAKLPELLLATCLDPLHNNERVRFLALQFLRKCLHDPTARADANCSRVLVKIFDERGMDSLESACLLLAQGKLLALLSYTPLIHSSNTLLSR